MKFLPYEAIDHRWYDRPYYLGPDDSLDAYTALAEALKTTRREGLAHWVMRNKEYHGALRLFQGYPMLMSPRSQEQVVSIDELEATKGKPLDQRELNMARQLISMLEARFDPEEYQDEYRGRVLELIEKKQKGDRIKRPRQRPEKPMDDISKALEASLEGMENGR